MYGRFDCVLVEVDKNKIIVRKIDVLVTPLNPNYVRTRSLNGLYESSWKYGYENARPSQGV